MGGPLSAPFPEPVDTGVVPPATDGAPRAAATPARHHDDWDEGGSSWPGLILILVLHLLGLFGLMQIESVRETVKEVAPIMVGLITLPPPEPPKPKPLPPPPKPAPVKPKPKPQMIAAPTPEPAPIVVPEPEPLPVEEPPPPPPAAPAPAAPVIPPSFVAAYLDNPAPAYPASSRRLGETGKVLLRVVVDPQGRPQSIEIERSSGHHRLDRAAQDAVRRWKFVPARQGDQAVTAAVLIPINFELSAS